MGNLLDKCIIHALDFLMITFCSYEIMEKEIKMKQPLSQSGASLIKQTGASQVTVWRPKRSQCALLFQMALWVMKEWFTCHIKSACRRPAVWALPSLKTRKHPINYLLSSHTEDLTLNSVWGQQRCQRDDRCTGGSRCPQHASLRVGSCTKTELSVCLR